MLITYPEIALHSTMYGIGCSVYVYTVDSKCNQRQLTFDTEKRVGRTRYLQAPD